MRRDVCAQAGALQSLCHVLRVNESQGFASVVLLSIRAIGAISMNNEQHRETLATSGIVAALVGALRQHFATQGVTDAVSAVIYNLAMSANPALKQQLVNAGAVQELVKAGTAQVRYFFLLRAMIICHSLCVVLFFFNPPLPLCFRALFFLGGGEEKRHGGTHEARV